MKFAQFQNNRAEQLVRQFFKQVMSDGDLTLLELSDALADPDVRENLADIKLSEVTNVPQRKP